MKRLEELKRNNDTRYFTNGKVSFPLDLSKITYASRIDLEHAMYAERDEECDYPTINELIASGSLQEKSYIKMCDVDYEKYPAQVRRMDEKQIDALLKRVQNKFKANGFNVTLDALTHNLNAWLLDYKSGYRDEANKYHLFTPCGCNPLSFRASELDEHCRDWQTTYEA